MLAPRIALLIAVPAVLATATVAGRADELSAAGSSHGIVIHDAASTLREFCSRGDDGRTWFTLPDGARFELITSTSDPDIANPGDGAFHAFDAVEVRDALDHVTFPLRGVGAEVFLLPYPRRLQTESAAGPGLILLSPGVRPLSTAHQHAELAHELGHVVQYSRMPDGDARWSDYRHLRAIDDVARYSGASVHANRPHEIFAEDFRALFGDALANYSGSIENGALAMPAQVPGLDAFLLELAGPADGTFAATPNPARGAVRFSLPHAAAVPLDLYDAAGRRVATLAPNLSRTGVEWLFRGVDDAGRKLGPGVLYARPRGFSGRSLRVVVLP